MATDLQISVSNRTDAGTADRVLKSSLGEGELRDHQHALPQLLRATLLLLVLFAGPGGEQGEGRGGRVTGTTTRSMQPSRVK